MRPTIRQIIARILCLSALCAAVGCSGGGGEGPAEIRVHRNVVNVISEEATSRLRDFLDAGYPGAPFKAARTFYRSFSDDYDFLFLVTDGTWTATCASRDQPSEWAA